MRGPTYFGHEFELTPELKYLPRELEIAEDEEWEARKRKNAANRAIKEYCREMIRKEKESLPQKKVIPQEARSALKRILNHHLLRMRYVEGLTLPEIALIMGCSQSNIRMRIQCGGQEARSKKLKWSSLAPKIRKAVGITDYLEQRKMTGDN